MGNGEVEIIQDGGNFLNNFLMKNKKIGGREIQPLYKTYFCKSDYNVELTSLYSTSPFVYIFKIYYEQ